MSRFHRRFLRPRCFSLSLLVGLVLSSAVASAQMGDFRDEMDQAQTVLDRTQEILEKVGSEVREADVPKARELFGAAVELQTRARQIFVRASSEGGALAARNQLRQSVTLSLRSRDTALQSGKVLREQVTLQRRSQRILEQAVEHLTRLKESADDRSDSTLRDLLRRAQSQLERAQRQYRDGNFEIALRLAQTSLDLLQSAGSVGGGGGAQQRYESMLEQAKRTLERARGDGQDLDEATLQRLNRAADLIARSQEQARSGHPRVAVELLNRARGLLAGLGSTEGRRIDDVRQAVQRLERNLATLEDELGDAPQNVRRMLDRAREEHRRSMQALRAGKAEPALRHHRAAVDLLTRVRNWVDDRHR